MKYFQNPIIPINQKFYNKGKNELVDWIINSNNTLDLKAISTFCALGFMLDDDTYFNEIKVLRPSTKATLKDNKIIINQEKTWDWNYNPIERPFNIIVKEFKEVFEKNIINRTKERNVLLPISGGLDSRTLLLPIKNNSNLILSSYEFEGGVNEIKYGQELAAKFNIPFYSQKISKGYLWSNLNRISLLNNCFSEFTHPRQLAVLNNWSNLGDIVLLGHMGDLLFESQADSKHLSYEKQLIVLKSRIIKDGGYELASDLWEYWGMEDSFENYINNRIEKLYSKINIEHPSARLRAFKSLYWVPRWSSINLLLFQEIGELLLPYYDDEMCKFICTVPEHYLKGRKIQIEYIKKYCKESAQVPWQAYSPLNLFQYHTFNSPLYYPIRFGRKLKRLLNENIKGSPKIITRNWELQFLGKDNLFQLKNNLFRYSSINKIIPKKIINKYLDKFYVEPVKYSHPISMLLTLSIFLEKYFKK